ncbi:carboxypeptidase-like regulatory domain-containing protein [Candidatus Nitrosotenuis cloacae]|uniref:carboxypeptidase-like regulatory domain-containing protein n=1 Tax=Candidatus Nitrosotenuis cloacae TaxID=1603555 RepID=UPI0011DCCEA8|nr:carboxypeptidase-like regulatory domain-containing protein [Candidatus Nitrosotenuis cloacae]
MAAILVFGTTTSFAAKPWDLVIKAQFEEDQIEANQKPVIYGSVTDQVGRPVSGVELKIRFADNSITTTTDEEGNFRHEFGEQTSQGIFSVNISATLYDLKGFASTTLKVGKTVSTFDDIYYTKDFDKDLKNDPYKALKQKQYQKFIEDQNKRKLKQNEIEAKKMALQDKRDTASQKRSDAINATKPGAGVYSYDEQNKYISKIDPRAKDTIRAQMDYTRQVYEEAKYEMQKVLENGGSLADAKKAYFDKIASTQNEIGDVGSANNTENHSKIKKHQDSKINSKKVKGLTYNKNLK